MLTFSILSFCFCFVLFCFVFVFFFLFLFLFFFFLCGFFWVFFFDEYNACDS